MVTVSQIRDSLIDFLDAKNRDESLASFEEWLAKSSWNMQIDSDIQAQRFVGEIQLYLAEMDAENRDYKWLLKRLRFVLSSLPLENSENPQIVSTGSSATFMTQEWAFSPVGNSREVAFGLPVPH
jgi:hypothetical protein